MDSNSVSPMPEMAPMAEFDKSPPSPPETPPLGGGADDLPPPPVPAVGIPVGDGGPKVAFGDQTPLKHRQYEDDSEWACANWFEYMLVVVLASLLLLGSLTLTLFWVLYYRKGFAWTENPQLQFNLHPVLMVAGFVTFSGFSLLLYRICRCCRRIYVKLFHTIFHALAIPCVVVGFIAVLDSHNLASPPIANFYSLHSWMGLVTMGLFALQFVVGFFSFLILLCCEGATAAFRASLVPIHATFGITTFMLAVATCLTGLTEKVFFTLSKGYSALPEEAFLVNSLAMLLTGSAIVVGYIVMREDLRDYASMPEEGIVVNALAMVLVALGILLSYAVRRDAFRTNVKSFVTERL